MQIRTYIEKKIFLDICRYTNFSEKSLKPVYPQYYYHCKPKVKKTRKHLAQICFPQPVFLLILVGETHKEKQRAA